MNAGLPEGHSTWIYQKVNKKMHGLNGLHLAGLGRSVLRPYLCSEKNHLREHEGTRSLGLGAEISTGLRI